MATVRAQPPVGACPHAVESMASLNADAARAALAAGIEAATDVTGFGLLGHLHKLTRASGVRAVIDASANEIYTGQLSGKILSVSLSGQTAAALTAGKLWFCPLSSTETTSAADAGGDACAVALKDGDSAYLLGISSVRLVNRR